MPDDSLSDAEATALATECAELLLSRIGDPTFPNDAWTLTPRPNDGVRERFELELPNGTIRVSTTPGSGTTTGAGIYLRDLGGHQVAASKGGAGHPAMTLASALRALPHLQRRAVVEGLRNDIVRIGRALD